MRPKILRLFAALTVLTMLAAPVSAQPPRADTAQSPAAAGKGGQEYVPAEAASAVPHPGRSEGVIGEIKGSTEAAYYLIQFVDAPLASYRGGIPGLQPTNPDAAGAHKLDTGSPASQAYTAYLQGQQALMIGAIEQALGRPVEVLRHYTAAFNGIAAWLTPQEAAAVAKLDGVRQVQRNELRFPLTDVGPEWIGAAGIWDGTTTGGLPGTRGEGVIVGVIDTGINADHPSFADIGGDGYDHTNPFGSGNYVGWCESGFPVLVTCNDKLIGAWSYPEAGDNPEDDDSHGSHTASTAAGNVVTSTLTAPTTSITDTISGVAPHANIIAYDACDVDGCPLTALVAAIDQTVIDGVDVINYSISGGNNPYTDSASQAFLAAVGAGVFVSASAGNSGPGASTNGHSEPWVQTVGASTHNRNLVNALTSMSGGSTTPPGDMTGKSFTAGYGPAQIVYAGDFGDPLCPPGEFSAGTFSGEIVVCDRGTYARVDKAQSVLDGGAGGFVLANDAANGDSLNGDGYALPGVHITYDDGVTLKAWLASGSGHMATIAGTTVNYDAANGDIMAAFSSRGPSAAHPDLLKPDVTAPGVDIWAAFADGTTTDPEYGFISGTSMSSPHSAGAAALIRALHPDWSPAQIKSALMTTSDPSGVLKEDGATTADPFDMGAGRIDLSGAGEAGLVLDETEADYTAADPSLGGDLTSLNLPSLASGACLQVCSWTRTISGTLGTSTSWTASVTGTTGLTLTVDPPSFTLPAFGTQMITVTAQVAGLPTDTYAFGQVTLSEDGAQAPDARFPVAVLPTAGALPGTVEILTRRNAGSQLVTDLTAIEISSLNVDPYGLTQAGLTMQSLSEDPTPGDPYDNLNDGTVFYITQTVAAGAKRLVAEITASEAPDIDLFVGLDADGDGPELSEELGFSASASWDEYVNLDDPAPGTYWILVQNWAASGTPPDDVTLAAAVVPGTDSGNMTVTGPASVTAGTPFDLRVFWDTPGMTEGDRWYGAFDVGSSAGTPGDIGTVAVDIVRLDDDVAKTASAASASAGSTLTYTITIQPNLTPEDLTYTITDTIPAGLTYVSGTVTGGAVVTGDTLTWTGTLPAGTRRYEMTTSLTDPACEMPLAGLDGEDDAYINLQAFGILADSGVDGDSVAYGFTYSGGSIEYFGEEMGTTINFADDGIAFFDLDSWLNSTPWVNTGIPDPSDPNSLLAMFWRDLEIVYNGATNRGVTLAELDDSFGPIALIIEYDDVEVFGDPSSTYDFEILIYEEVSDVPGEYEIAFAYDNLVGNLITGTVGVENGDGTLGTQYAYNDSALAAITEGMAICFDWAVPAVAPVTITYQVTVDETDTPATLTNTVQHSTDNPGSETASTSASVMVGPITIYMPLMFRQQ